MLHKLRRRAEDEKGFTLIELLVVILIIGILAAIAIPTFLNQKSKANDASAESLARNAATAMETYATDNNGSYSGIANASVLNSITPGAEHQYGQRPGLPVLGPPARRAATRSWRVADRHGAVHADQQQRHGDVRRAPRRGRRLRQQR